MTEGVIKLEKCSGDLTAEEWVFEEELTLEERQQAVLTRALELGIVPKEAASLYGPRGRRIIVVEPSHPEL